MLTVTAIILDGKRCQLTRSVTVLNRQQCSLKSDWTEHHSADYRYLMFVAALIWAKHDRVWCLVLEVGLQTNNFTAIMTKCTLTSNDIMLVCTSNVDINTQLHQQRLKRKGIWIMETDLNPASSVVTIETSGYDTWFTAGGAIRIAHYDVINSETIRDRVKRRPPRPMKSSELSNGVNRTALRQLLQNRKLCHL